MKQVPVQHLVQPAAECERPGKAGLVQALGVFIDTIVICSCTAMIMLLAPEKMLAGKEGMELLQAADAVSFRGSRSYIYCDHAVFVQLFNILGNPFLCEK